MSQTQKTKILDKVLHSESYKQGSYQTLSGPLERTRSQPERTPAGQRWNNLIIIQNNCNGLKCSDRGGKKRETDKRFHMKNIKLEDKEQKTYQTKVKEIGIRNTK